MLVGGSEVGHQLFRANAGRHAACSHVSDREGTSHLDRTALKLGAPEQTKPPAM